MGVPTLWHPEGFTTHGVGPLKCLCLDREAAEVYLVSGSGLTGIFGASPVIEAHGGSPETELVPPESRATGARKARLGVGEAEDCMGNPWGAVGVLPPSGWCARRRPGWERRC